MSLRDGIYHVSSYVKPFRLAGYEDRILKVNDSSNVLVEVASVSGGYRMRFVVGGHTDAWFSADDNLTEDSKIYFKDGKSSVWSITPAGPGLHKIGIYNKDAVWYLSEHPSNPEDVKLGKSQGRATELWNFEPAN